MMEDKPQEKDKIFDRLISKSALLNILEDLCNAKTELTQIFNTAGAGMRVIDKNFNILRVSMAFTNLSGISENETLGKKCYEIFPGPQCHTPNCLLTRIFSSEEYVECDVEKKRKDGIRIPCIVIATPLRGTDGELIGIVEHFTNITKRKEAEKMLQKQKTILEQKNIALSELLGQIELEKKQIKDNVIANAENLLLPIIQKLRLKGESHKYVNLLRKNLQELASSFGVSLIKKGSKLSPREIEICNMIKNGLTSKEIANLLNISLSTVERHRNNIRNKFGIVKKSFNLTSFLKTC